MRPLCLDQSYYSPVIQSHFERDDPAPADARLQNAKKRISRHLFSSRRALSVRMLVRGKVFGFSLTERDRHILNGQEQVRRQAAYLAPKPRSVR